MFLTRFAQIILKSTAIATGLMPAVGASVPGAAPFVAKVESEISNIAGLVTTAEVIGQTLGTKGADKARSVAPLVAQEILRSSFMANKKIKDPTAFNKACETIGGGVADLLNSLHEDGIDEKNKA